MANAVNLNPPLQQPKRALALDALRGYAILTMVLSGMAPVRSLPDWMSHAQTPPPAHKFIPIPGITWVDLVFPFFLFALGAAIPFALRRRIEKGMKLPQAVLTVFKRGLLLLAFAVFEEHVNCWVIGKDSLLVAYFNAVFGCAGIAVSPEVSIMVLALLGFVIMFMVLARLPDSWPPVVHGTIRLLGWAGGITMCALVGHWDQGLMNAAGGSVLKEFWARVWGILTFNNIILLLLTHAAVFGSLAWLLTRDNLLLRLGFLGAILGLRLGMNLPGWTHWINEHVSTELMGLGTLSYQFIVIPGTIAGDMVLRWMREPHQTKEPVAERPTWSGRRLWGIAALSLAFIVVCLVGLQSHWDQAMRLGLPVVDNKVDTLALRSSWVAAAVVIVIVMCAAGWALFSNPSNSSERLLRSLYQWGACWLILGLIFEPYEGGIKKDGATMSYYFVTDGLAIFMLIAFTIIIDIKRHSKWFAALVIENGQNPMIAYVGGAHLLMPIMVLTGIATLIEPVSKGAAAGTIVAVIQTLIIALVVCVFTKCKIFWRT